MMDPVTNSCSPAEPDADIDLREVYFLIMHFLSTGPCRKTFEQFCNELLEHQLLPRRYHAWYSRSGSKSGDEDDDGMSFPLCYASLVDRYSHIGKDHLVKLLKQLIMRCSTQLDGTIGGTCPNAADVPTILGSGSFSLLASNREKEEKTAHSAPNYLRWPHMHADQVRGLRLRELGGGFTKHHRAPSVRAACYAIAKPSTLVQKMEVIKKLRGHQNAVYCAIFDCSGRYVITGSDDRLVKIWSMETTFCLASCRGHEGDITDLAVSSNNALVASSSNDFIIRVWRLPDGLPISVLRGHTGVVTAIAFSPRSVYQLLSSSDDGTCRIWDARHSQLSPRLYMPKLADALAGKSSEPSTSVAQPNLQIHQILCCAFNANGTVFVTGSSDTYARVWNACKSNSEDPEQPSHEMDLLSGHENDVNYVQFSGCAVPSRTSTADTFKEDNLPKFKNSWFTHDNIVTCSRDGSAIIWIPRSRRYHGKIGRWIRAYHLKVPPPPTPPQPIRGGPRQRAQPTPRGVNMIVWSLDNRFVLAAIMDCRICVWNASDGSLVHSLIGHSESTFVLDVHPFNPRIAMSAGYDGKTIIWDIWEGTPVRIYETGRFKLVDGKFSPDGTSIILSDEVGQMYIIATGQGESQKDAKYDQFFLGDYRPLIQDINGNVVDQETQLVTYRRNIQDLLCDSSMIPYPDPYQSIYQRRRLGMLGIEWRPSSVSFAVGTTFSTNGGDYQMPPIIDLDQWIEPLPEFLDVIDWEPPENEIQSDDNDSEYNVTDENASEAEHEILSSSSSEHIGGSHDDSGIDQSQKDPLRRSRRMKRISEPGFTTSSGRRVKRRNLDENDGVTSVSKPQKKHMLKHGKSNKRKKLSKSKAGRPQRRSAQNALNMFSKMKGFSSEEEDFDLETSSSESESGYPDSNDSENSLNTDEKNLSNLKDDFEDAESPPEPNKIHSNPENRRKIVLKLPRRDLSTISSTENAKSKLCEQEEKVELLSTEISDESNLNKNHTAIEAVESSGIKWGEVKARSSKRVKLGEDSNFACADNNGRLNSEDDARQSPQNDLNVRDKCDIKLGDRLNSTNGDYCSDALLSKTCQYGRRIELGNGCKTMVDSKNASNGAGQFHIPERNKLKIRIKSNGLKLKDNVISPGKPKSSALEDSRRSMYEPNSSKLPEEDVSPSGQSLDHSDTDDETFEEKSNTKMFKVIYKKSKSSRGRKLFNGDAYPLKECTSNHDNASDSRTTRSMGMKVRTDVTPVNNNGRDKERCQLSRASRNNGNLSINGHGSTLYGDFDPPLSLGTRSARIRRETYSGNLRPLDLKSSHNLAGRKLSWLLLIEHEESYRYIPQLGDEVAYLIQGHEEYTRRRHSSQEACPFKIKGLRSVEFCIVQSLDYATLPGSGESCCKLTLEFTDPSSTAFGKTFKLTLPELVVYPDFLVERTRYDASIQRNWVHRDKCFVWWRNEDGISGSWWEGRILEVKPKSTEFMDSPWENIIITYKGDPVKHSHSPWELHDDKVAWQHPHIDEDTRDAILSRIAKLERTSAKKDKFGVERLNQVAQKSEFLNRFPVPLSLDVIKSRLENNYYRTFEAVKHDASVMVSNGESYFGKNIEMSTKMRRLSDWVEETFSSL